MSNKNSKKIQTDKRASDLKLFSVGSVAILFAILLVFNILLYVLLDEKLSFDTSSTEQNSISDISKEYIDNLPSDTKIRIVGLFDKPTSIKDTQYEYICPLLSDLEDKSSGKVKVEYVNPNTHPNIINELDPNGVTDIRNGLNSPTFAVFCDGKVRLVDAINDCFNCDMDQLELYQTFTPIANKTESAFINSIIAVTSESSAKVYYLTGLQEDTHDTFDTIFASMNIETAELDVASENFKVPDDCDMLLILGPDVDISESVQEAIKDYLHNGKHPCNILVSVGIDSDNSTETYPHLNNVLNEVNLAFENKIITDDDTSNVISLEGSAYKGHLADDYLYNNSTGIVTYQLSRNIIAYGAEQAGLVTKPMVVTSDSTSLVSPDGATKAGQLNVAMVTYSEGFDQPINVFVFGSKTFTSDEYFAGRSSNDDNNQFMRSLLTGIFKTSNSIDVPVKPMLDYSIDSSKVDQNSVSAVSIIFLVAIPLVFVFVAWYVYYRRSHL